MKAAKVSWIFALGVWWSIMWRASIIWMAPLMIAGLIVGSSDFKNLPETIAPQFPLLIQLAWIIYSFWCWIWAVKVILERLAAMPDSADTERKGFFTSQLVSTLGKMAFGMVGGVMLAYILVGALKLRGDFKVSVLLGFAFWGFVLGRRIYDFIFTPTNRQLDRKERS